MATYDSVQFNQSDLNGKFNILFEISKGIAHKYISTNSPLPNFTVEDISQELGIVVWNMLSSDDTKDLGWYIKSLYNRAVDLYRKARVRANVNVISLSGVMDDGEDSDSDSRILSNIRNYDHSSNDESILKISSKLGTTDDVNISLILTDLLKELEYSDPLALKYVVLKLVYNHIEVDPKYMTLVENIDLNSLKSEYDFVLALGHYKSPKSGSWYDKKFRTKQLLMDLLF